VNFPMLLSVVGVVVCMWQLNIEQSPAWRLAWAALLAANLAHVAALVLGVA
jgi:hypothetical protein